MKKLIALAMFLILPLVACDDASHEINPVSEEFQIKSEIPSGLLTVNFNALFYSDQTDPGELDAGCMPPFVFPIYQVGYGKTPVLGKFKFEALFCINPLTGEYTNGETSFGKMIFEDGDELFVKGDGIGQVVPSDHPNHETEFSDPWIVTGGTGKFTGATGSGFMDSYGKTPPRTQHHWKGTLYLLQEKN